MFATFACPNKSFLDKKRVTHIAPVSQVGASLTSNDCAWCGKAHKLDELADIQLFETELSGIEAGLGHPIARDKFPRSNHEL
jgi:hypothetical protein